MAVDPLVMTLKSFLMWALVATLPRLSIALDALATSAAADSATLAALEAVEAAELAKLELPEAAAVLATEAAESATVDADLTVSVVVAALLARLEAALATLLKLESFE